MSINKHEIEHIAHLAKLEMSDNDLSGLEKNLNDILSYISVLNEVNTDQVPVLDNPVEEYMKHTACRDDIAKHLESNDHYQNIAPMTDQGYYLIPNVFEPNEKKI